MNEQQLTPTQVTNTTIPPVVTPSIAPSQPTASLSTDITRVVSPSTVLTPTFDQLATIDVRTPSQVQQPSIATTQPTMQSVPFSSRRIVIVSAVIALIVVLIAGITTLVLSRRNPPIVASTIPTQGLSLSKSSETSPTTPSTLRMGVAIPADFAKDVAIAGNLKVLGQTTFGDSLTVQKALTLNGSLTVTGDTIINGNLNAVNLNVQTITATNISGDGADLNNLNATNITQGTLADARLSTNVALQDSPNVFTGQNSFTQPITGVDAINSNELVTLGQLTTISAGNYFLQNGNSFGGTATIGTNDVFDLALETNGTTRAHIDNTGHITFGGLAPLTSGESVLEINGGTSLNVLELLTNTNNGFIQFKNETNTLQYGSIQYDAGISALRITGNGQGLGFSQSGGANPINLFIAPSSGNVGIGTTTGINSKLTFAADTTAAGGILFGTDTNLYRSAADILKTDDSFVVLGRVSVERGTGNAAIQTKITGDVGTRWQVTTDGVNLFGNGTTDGGDTNLYRSAANTLKTDNAFIVGTLGSSGTVALCSNSGQISTCSGAGANTLQGAYDGGSTITTADARNIQITLADTATDQTLEVTQAGTADAFRVNDDGTFTDTTPFVIDASGNVGVGTSSPLDAFNVVSNSGVTFNRITSSANGAYIRVQSARGTVGAPTIASSGDAFMRLMGQSYDGASYLDAARITMRVDGTPGLNDMPGSIAFETTPDGSSSLSTRMTIKNDGNVGIGDISPDAKLEVLSTTEQLRLTHTDGTVDSRFTVDASGNLTIDNTGTTTTIADDLAVNGGDITSTVALTIDGTGTLTLADNVSASGTLIVTGLTTLNGGLTVETGDIFTFNGDAFDDLTGTGLQIVGGDLQTTLGTSVQDSEVDNNLTIDSTGSVDWLALTNYPTACSAGSAVSTLADVPTCTPFNTDTAITLQDAYNTDADGSDAVIALTSADGGVIIRDNTTPIASTLFAVQTSGSANFLSVTASGINLGVSATLAANQTINLTGGATGSRPGSPTEGMVFFDTTTKTLITYANGKWQATTGEYIIVAASNSSQAIKDAAHYVADGNGGGAGDGDQVQINAALTAASGGKVYLAAGTYVADATILIPNNTMLAGAGRGTLIELADLDATDNLIENSDITTGTGVTIQDLRIDGRNDLNTAGTQHGIRFSGMGSGTGSTARQGAKLTNLWANRFRDSGIILTSSSNNTLTGNTAQGNFYGFNLGTASNNTLTGNTALGNTLSSFYLDSFSANNTLTGNTAQGSFYDFYVSQSSNNTFTGNTVLGSASSYGFNLNNSSNNNTITGNNVQGNDAGITLSSSNNNTVSGNKLHNIGTATANNAIYLNAGDFNSITDNNITDTACTTTCYAINVFDSTSDKNYLEGNRFSGSATNAASINDTGTNTIYVNQQTNTTTSTNSDVSDFRFRGSANSTTAFAIQNATGASILNIDTTNAEVEVGNSTTAGKLVVSDGSSNTATILVAATAGDYSFTIPTVTANDTFCLFTLANCSGSGSGGTLQAAYNAGNTITTTDARNIQITLADTTTDQTVEITQVGTADAFRVNDDGTFSDSTPFVIDASGNVGIGTTGPSQKLEVAGAGATRLSVNDTTDGTVVNLSAQAGSAYLYTVTDSPLNFATNNQSAQVTLLQSGNVGIGTTGPTGKLDVAYSNSAAATAWANQLLSINTDTTTDNGAGIKFMSYNASSALFGGVAITAQFTDRTAGAENANLLFATRNSGNLAEKMRIDTGGNVAINTTTTNFVGANANSRVLSISGDNTGGNFHRGVIELRNLLDGGAASGSIYFTSGNNIATASLASIQGGAEGSGGVSGYGSYLNFSTKTDNGAFAERLRISNSGNVGIGTTTPGAQFDVQATAGGATIWASNANGNANLTNGTTLGQLEFAGYFNGSVNDVARIRGFYTGDGTTRSGELGFFTHNLGSTSEKLRISSAGNVGIGTVSPEVLGASASKILSVYGGAGGSVLTLGNDQGTISTNARIEFNGVTSGGNPREISYIESLQTSTTGAGALVFGTHTGAAVVAGTEKMRITSDGNVGIGTTSPQQALTLTNGDNFATNMATPGTITDTGAITGGTLAAGTYYHKVTALDGVGETIGSVESTCTVASGTTGSCAMSWTAITGAASYKIYRTTVSGTYGATSLVASSTTASYTDTGSVLVAGTVPTVTTAYVNKLTASGNSYFLGGNVGIGTTAPGAQLQINPTNTSTVGLIVHSVGAGADLTQWKNTGGSVIASVATSGLVSLNNSSSWLNNPNAGQTASLQAAGATKVALVVQGAASQTANLQEWQDSTGAVLSSVSAAGVLAVPSIVSAPTSLTAFSVSQAYQDQMAYAPNGLGVTGRGTSAALTVNGNGGSPILTISNGVNPVLTIGGSGEIQLQHGALGAADAQIARTAAGQITVSGMGTAVATTLIIKGVASQTANLQEWQDSTGTVLSRIESSGGYGFTAGANDIKFKSTGGWAQLSINNSNNGIWFNNASDIIVSSPAGIWLEPSNGDSTKALYINATGGHSLRGQLTIQSHSTSWETLIVKQLASQTADLQQWQDSAGTVLASVDASGYLATPGSYTRANSTAFGRNAGLADVSATPTFLTAVGVSALRSNTTGSYNSAFGIETMYYNTTGIRNSAFGAQALLANDTGIYNSAVGYAALGANTTGNYNSALGANSLGANTTGSYNSALGHEALRINTTGVNNSAVGYNALYANTTGGSNSALGRDALYANTTGNYNSAIGVQALYANTTGTQNSALGVNALSVNTTGASNSAVGVNALQFNTIGTYNTAVGAYALQANTDGSWNSAVGYSALAANTTGIGNNAFGHEALKANTTGGNNSAFGHQAFKINTTGSSNSAFGALALHYNTTGGSNSAFGAVALHYNTTGTNNTAVGVNALYDPNFSNLNATTTGSRQTAVGFQTGQASATQRNDIVVIGYRAVVDGDNAIAIGSGASAGAAGAVAIGKDSANTSASTTTTDEIKLGTALHTVNIPGAAKITAGAAGIIPLTVKGAASQTANLQEWQNSAGTVQASVSASGAITLGSVAPGNNGVFIGHTTPLLYLRNSSNYEAQLVLDQNGQNAQFGIVAGDGVSLGALRVETLRANTLRSTDNYIAGTLGGGKLTLGGQYATTTALVVKGDTNQWANLQEWQDSAGSVLAKVSAAGQVTAPTLQTSAVKDLDGNPLISLGSGVVNFGNIVNFTSPNAYAVSISTDTFLAFNNSAALAVQPTAATSKGLVIKGFAAQTADLLQAQDSTGSVLAKIQANGIINGLAGVQGTALGIGVAPNAATALVNVFTGNAAYVGQIIKGAASQTADLLQVQNSSAQNIASITSAGTLMSYNPGLWLDFRNGAGSGTSLLKMYSTGASRYEPVIASQNGPLHITSNASGSGAVVVDPSAPSGVALIARGAATQTGDLQQWQNSAETVLASMSASGDLAVQYVLSTVASKAYLQMNADTGGIKIYANAAANKALIVQGAASQTADLLQAQDSTGAVLASITAAGDLTAKNATFTGILTVNGHIITGNLSGTTTATINANAGTGGTPACSVSGNDTGGQITLTTGTSAWAAGTQCTINFAGSFGAAPHPVLTPASSVDTTAVKPYVTSATGSFTVSFITADTAQRTYTFNYFNTQ